MTMMMMMMRKMTIQRYEPYFYWHSSTDHHQHLEER